MAKTYQSYHFNYQLVLDNDQNPNPDIYVRDGIVSFHAVPERLTNKVFGEFTSDNPQILTRFVVRYEDKKTKREKQRKILPEELEAMIEQSNAFTRGVDKDGKHALLGISGVWPKEEREEWLKSQAGAQATDSGAAYTKLSDALLISIIEEDKAKYPVKGDNEDPAAYHAKLVAIVVELKK